MSVANVLNHPDSETNTYSGVGPATTGDGKASGGSACPGPGTTKWYLFATNPVPGYTADSCGIPMNKLLPYFCQSARQLALDNAQVLKNNGIKIYIIGLGSSPRDRPGFPPEPFQRQRLYLYRTDPDASWRPFSTRSRRTSSSASCSKDGASRVQRAHLKVSR